MTQKQENVLTRLNDGLFYEMKQFTFDSREEKDKEDLEKKFNALREKNKKMFYIVKFYNDGDDTVDVDDLDIVNAGDDSYFILYREDEYNKIFKRYSIRKFKDDGNAYIFQVFYNKKEKEEKEEKAKKDSTKEPIKSTFEDFVGNRTGLLNRGDKNAFKDITKFKGYDEMHKHLNINPYNLNDLVERAEYLSDVNAFKNKKKKKSNSKKSRQKSIKKQKQKSIKKQKTKTNKSRSKRA
jgi:hypothetical protein